MFKKLRHIGQTQVPQESVTLATFQSMKYVWISVGGQVTWFMEVKSGTDPPTRFSSHRELKKKNHQVQVEIAGWETVQGFRNKRYNQKANNLDAKPHIGINQN